MPFVATAETGKETKRPPVQLFGQPMINNGFLIEVSGLIFS